MGFGVVGRSVTNHDVAVASWYVLRYIVYFIPSPYPHLDIHNLLNKFFLPFQYTCDL